MPSRTEENHDTQAPVTRKLRRAQKSATAYFRENPMLCSAVAVGVGFVLGGGLTTAPALRLLRKGAGVALQIVVLPLLLSRLRGALLDIGGQE